MKNFLNILVILTGASTIGCVLTVAVAYFSMDYGTALLMLPVAIVGIIATPIMYYMANSKDVVVTRFEKANPQMEMEK